MKDNRWIVFDLIGVLAEPSWRDIVVSDPALRARWERFKRGTEQEDAFWNEALQKTYRQLLVFRPDRLKLVQKLRRDGFHIAIASNFSKDWLDTLLKKLPEPGLFEKTLVSSEAKAAKPEQAFWDKMKEFAPEGSIFVDDRRDNCDAAERAGYRAIWAHPGAEIEQELADRLRAA